MLGQISAEYFEWLCNTVAIETNTGRFAYTKLLSQLYDIEFTYTIERDRNRAEDGINLRYRFAIMNGYEDMYKTVLCILDGPCSVLEMMIALAIRCEENIMDDPDIGDRTKQWFWEMVTSLGLGPMTDDEYDWLTVKSAIERFLYREYFPDGRGGLFTIRGCDRDMRTIEIWSQLCRYLDSIV